MSGHTKGPWEAGTTGVSYLNPDVVTDSTRTICGDGYVVAVTITDVEELDNLANAHLIAAAPELLEALIALRNLLWSEGYADQNLDMAKADAVIAKAEGRE